MRGPAYGNADPGMVVQPYADPGYAMTNVPQGNLNQAPGQEIGGYLPAAANSLTPWIESLPMALQQWDRLTPEQRTMYEAAYRAHSGGLANERSMEGLRRTEPRDPNWAEKYPGF